MALFVLSLYSFDISAGVGAFVLGLSQISSFFSLKGICQGKLGIVIKEVLWWIRGSCQKHEVPLSRMVNYILLPGQTQWKPSTDQTLYPSVTFSPNSAFYRIMRGFYRTIVTGLVCRQETLTPPDTWSCLILDLHMFNLLRPILFPNSSLCFPDYAFRTSLGAFLILLVITRNDRMIQNYRTVSILINSIYLWRNWNELDSQKKWSEVWLLMEEWNDLSLSCFAKTLYKSKLNTK